uniref:Uncharacterized protein n=1 Tax=Candidatus Kentrum sp. LFY TaxID=2126342 RepID=A0A450U8S5_9GAMM|nr:MAG: hypothetical protein BECKLFY1418B_GA0070995_101017 [Candidatus Kentron sp. LFY]
MIFRVISFGASAAPNEACLGFLTRGSRHLGCHGLGVCPGLEVSLLRDPGGKFTIGEDHSRNRTCRFPAHRKQVELYETPVLRYRCRVMSVRGGETTGSRGTGMAGWGIGVADRPFRKTPLKSGSPRNTIHPRRDAWRGEAVSRQGESYARSCVAPCGNRRHTGDRCDWGHKGIFSSRPAPLPDTQ